MTNDSLILDFSFFNDFPICRISELHCGQIFIAIYLQLLSMAVKSESYRISDSVKNLDCIARGCNVDIGMLRLAFVVFEYYHLVEQDADGYVFLQAEKLKCKK